MFYFSCLAAQIPGHALHEKGLQRQKGVGPLVGSQERRALLVPLINRVKTVCQPLILFPHSVLIRFCLFVLLERRGDVSSMPWGNEGRLSPERIALSASRPARPRPAAPPRAPTRPARGMSGFWIRQVILLYTGGHINFLHELSCRIT